MSMVKMCAALMLASLAGALPAEASAAAAKLTVTNAGSGRGSVLCNGSTCLSSYPAGSPVKLTASPDAASTFGGWSGACSGSTTCSLAMTTNRTVTATFTKRPVAYTLTINKAGAGAGSVLCNGGTCASSYPAGSSVKVSASPGVASTFGGWSGACSGSGTCSLAMTANRTVTASFTPAAGGSPRLVEAPLSGVQYTDLLFSFTWDAGAKPTAGVSLQMVGADIHAGPGSSTLARFAARSNEVGTRSWKLVSTASGAVLKSGLVSLASVAAFPFKSGPTSSPATPGVPYSCKPQCVAFVQFQLDLQQGIGNAWEYWTRYSDIGYKRFAQGSTRAPRPGDVLVWDSSLAGYGHVAVVGSVDLASGTLTLRDTNWDNRCGFSGDVPMTLTKSTTGGWTIGQGTGASRSVGKLIGWLSKDLAWPY